VSEELQKKTLRWLGVWLIALSSFVVQGQTNITVLRPPKQTLVAIHLPDLTQLENEVREQIMDQQRSLIAATRDFGSTDEELSYAYGIMGQTYHAYSLTAPARECYVNASRLAPKDFRWLYLIAKLDQQAGDIEGAISGFKLVRSLRPDFIAAQVNLGNIYLELNRLHDAQLSFNDALAIDKNSAAAYYGLGQVALSQRRYAEAVNYFQKSLELAPGANRIHYALAMAYRGLGDAENTKLHLAQQGTVGVRVADPLIDALPELVQGARVHMVRGRMALEAKRYAEAVAEFRRAVAATPDSVTAHVNLGAALTQTGDLNEAVEQFEAALLIDPNNTTAHYNLAVLLANANKHQQAIVHLEAVTRLAPNDAGALTLLITLLTTAPKYELRNGERALKLAQALYETTGSLDQGALVSQALSELGRCSEAADWQRKLIELASKQQRADLVTKLRAALQKYETMPCRPAGEP
jgi:tetratricopeptide (TPR) repeat protein